MIRHRLGVLIAIASAGSAHAVSLNPRGIGEVLLYPYYTVNKGQNTLVSVVNTGDVGQVVRVRFNEAYNGRAVLGFDLFLSPHDVWTAAITQASDAGGAILKSSDRSCTVPAIPEAGFAFVTAGFDGSVPGEPGDDGPHGITRTREGSIEIIAAGDIIPGSATDIAITHIQTGIPGEGTPDGCDALTPTGIVADIVAPTNALIGAGSIVNVGEGTFFGYNADAISDFTDQALLNNLPAGDGPSLDDANTAFSNGARAQIVTTAGKSLDIDYESGIDAVSAVLTMDSIDNEYVVDASIGAETDWIITFPTKRFYVDKGLYPAGVTAPFEVPFGEGHSPINFGSAVFDREEFTPPIGSCQMPQSCPPRMDFEVNAIPFRAFYSNPSSPVLGSMMTPIIGLEPLGSGWAAIDLAAENSGHVLDRGATSFGSVSLPGLPVVGFMVYNVVNVNAQPGLLANYSGLFGHRGHVSCVGAGCE